MAKDKKDFTGATVELADKETSFYDPETQLSLSRDGKAKIGDTVGRKTNTAIVSGRLLVISGGKKKAAKDEGEGDGGTGDGLDLPADLPGRDAFVAAGLTTFDQVKALETEEQLLAVKGIGKGTVKSLKEWAAANSEEK